MIRVNEIPNAAAAKAYYQARNADYYLEGHEKPAYWHGKVAEKLGLSGPVGMEAFHALCDNQHPRTGETLTAARGNRRVGYDFTFSVPKSVSVAYSLGQDERLDDAFRGAVADTMAEVEREMGTRVRKGKQDFDRRTGNMLWADFLHTTSRPIKGQPDPQLHIHAVAFNLTWDHEESEWKAGQFGGLKANAPYYQAVFRSRLATRLQDLGYELTRTKDDFEITGIPERANKEFSRRTTQIEKLADKLGVKKPETKAKLGATSREAKSKGLSWRDLLEMWDDRLRPGEREAINGTVHESQQGPMVVEDRSKESVDWALRHLLERKSVVSQRAVVTEALKHGLGFVTPENIYKEMAERRDLIRRDVKGVEMVSTQGVLAEEKRIAEFATKGKGRYRPLAVGVRTGFEPAVPVDALSSRPGTASRKGLLSPAHALDHSATGTQTDPATPPAFGQSKNETRRLSVAPGMPSHGATPAAFGQAAIKRQSCQDRSAVQVVDPKLLGPATNLSKLSPSQQAAVRHVWTSRDRLILLRGAAGTGKTTLTKHALAGVNVPWVILAPSAEASRGVLRREGFAEADTLAKFLTDSGMQEKVRGGLIWLDEASLAGAHDVAKLTQLADSLNARVVLSGDRRQHKSVSRGDVLGLLEDAGVPVAEVSEIRRQAGEYKAAVTSLSKGDVADGFRRLDRLGWVQEGGHEQIAEDYLAAVRDGKSVLVVSPTHAEGEKVTAAIREKLKAEGRLGGQEQRVGTLENLNLTEAQKGDPETLRQAAGEEAVFHKNSPLARAGARVTITAENAEKLAEHADRFAVFAHRDLALAAGDTVRITANGKTLDGEHRLNNGAVYRVDSFTSAGNIRLDNGWIVGKDNPHLAHGYVATSHAAQGRTVDRVLIAQSAESFPASGKEQFYVSVSRGRERATVYTNDKEALREAIGREDSRMLATDLVRRPRRGVRERIKKHVAWLRGVVQMSREQLLVANREMEVSRDR